MEASDQKRLVDECDVSLVLSQLGRCPMQMSRFIGKRSQRLDAKTIASRKVQKMGPPPLQARPMLVCNKEVFRECHGLYKVL